MIGTIFRTFGRRYMDVSLRAGADYVVRIVERPGVWMDDAALSALSADLRQVAARTLDAGSLTYGVFSGDKSRMEAVIITLVSRRDGTPVAFNALAVMKLDTAPHPTEVLHLGLVMVDPDERSKNLSWVLYGLTCFLIFFVASSALSGSPTSRKSPLSSAWSARCFPMSGPARTRGGAR